MPFQASLAKLVHLPARWYVYGCRYYPKKIARMQYKEQLTAIVEDSRTNQ
jgi:hypothetical protein